jgi:hypothetical protein
MDKISLIQELNEGTIKKTEFERALAESGFDLPPEDELDDGMDDELSDEEPVDDEIDLDLEDTGLDEDEIQDIVDWCAEECADMSDDELKDVLVDELEELELSPEQLNATITQVMSMLNREDDDEIEGEYDDSGDDIEGMDTKIEDEL